jgi:hypothetical protein
MASRTLLLLWRRHALLASVASRCASQRKRPAARTLASSSKPAIITSAERIHDYSEYSSFAFVALATAAAAAFVHSKKEIAVCGAAATAWDPQNIRGDTRQPRNVMLHSRRSIRARNLEDKYNVDWSTVLGEGAYGSVHPARLATTGEKVSQSWLPYRRRGHCCRVCLSYKLCRLLRVELFSTSSLGASIETMGRLVWITRPQWSPTRESLQFVCYERF